MRYSRTFNHLSDRFLMAIMFAFLHMVKLDQEKRTQWYGTLHIKSSNDELLWENGHLLFSYNVFIIPSSFFNYLRRDLKMQLRRNGVLITELWMTCSIFHIIVGIQSCMKLVFKWLRYTMNKSVISLAAVVQRRNIFFSDQCTCFYLLFLNFLFQCDKHTCDWTLV